MASGRVYASRSSVSSTALPTSASKDIETLPYLEDEGRLRCGVPETEQIMALTSSPINYPLSSSPVEKPRGQKRKLLDTFQSIKKPFARFGEPANTLPTSHSREPVTKACIRGGPFEDDDDDFGDDPGSRLLDRARPTNGDSIPASSPLSARFDLKTTGRDPISEQQVIAKTSNGLTLPLRKKQQGGAPSYESMIAARSETSAGHSTRGYYGVEIHALLDCLKHTEPSPREIRGQAEVLPLAQPALKGVQNTRSSANMLWTEKYRARKFTDLVGDDRVHRDVLKWLKRWDPMVFPGVVKPQSKWASAEEDPKVLRKILLLTGAPGLGKTTLAHVCARQAGYEVVEINASDDRTSSVVKGRIKDCLATESVANADVKAQRGKGLSAARPVCVVVDEVDGVVTGTSNSGEGGFMKALLDLVALDQRNSNALQMISGNAVKPRRKGDQFRQLRPLILICNDLYHPSIRPLRTSQMAQVIHIKRPPFDRVVSRLSSIFQKEGFSCDHDAVRKLCESAWGPASKKESNSQLNGTGDLRGCLVIGEWVAAAMRASRHVEVRLTRALVEAYTKNGSSNPAGCSGAGRGGTREIVERVFLDNAGFPKVADSDASINPMHPATGVTEAAKRSAMNRLREVTEAAGESDRILADCFAVYAAGPIQDDTLLSKPNSACEWLHFHDQISIRTNQSHEWELGPYLSQSILGFHSLLASSLKRDSNSMKLGEAKEEPDSPFSGPRAHLATAEALKQNISVLHAIQASLSIPLARSFRSVETLTTELIPQIAMMLTPNVKPVVVGGAVSVRKESERRMISRSIEVMDAVGASLERIRVESAASGHCNFVYRMEP